MERVAVIDIGSNSVRLVIFEVSNKGFNVIDEMKATVRLGEGLESHPYLSADSMKRAIETLRRFETACRVHGAAILAVATAATRKAKNGQAFVERIEQETGIAVRIISGQEEAFMDYLGVIHSTAVTEGLLIDIGGGSTELVLIRNREAVQSVSLPFGSLDLTRKFALTQTVTPDNEAKLTQYLKETFRKIAWLRDDPPGPLLGVGGIIRNIGKIDRRKKEYPLDLAHGYTLDYNDVKSIYDTVKGRDLEERKLVDGLACDRADIFVGANAVVKILMEFTGIKQLTISGYGLREGIIYHRILQKSPLGDVLEDSLEHIMDQYRVDYRHAYHVYHLYGQLFGQLQELHGIEEDLTQVNKVAALLHDIGLAIRYYDHQEHTFYLILNAGLVGLTHRELVLSAYIAASHRLKKFKTVVDEYKNLLKKDDRLLIRKAGVLMQIANSLDRGLIGKISDVSCQIGAQRVVIRITAQEDAALEKNEAMEAAAAFKKIFHKELVVS